MKKYAIWVVAGNIGLVAAEPTQYRLPDLVASFVDVIGFNYLDFISAIYSFIEFLIILGIAAAFWWVLWGRKH